MGNAFTFILQFCGAFFTLYGFLFFALAVIKKPKKGTTDKSNVWNRLIGPLYVAMHPETFGSIHFFKNDIGENIHLVEQAVIVAENLTALEAALEKQVSK